MSEYRWKWTRPDRPGVWAFSGSDSINPSRGPMIVVSVRNDKTCSEGWWCFLCDLPTIQPALPQLKLPAGWSDAGGSPCATHKTAVMSATGAAEISVWHPDEAKRIRAVQAAVDVLSE